MKREQVIRLRELEELIPMEEMRLAYKINRYKGIKAYDAPNAKAKRQLIEKYRREIQSTTDYIDGMKTELRDLQELSIART